MQKTCIQRDARGPNSVAPSANLPSDVSPSTVTTQRPALFEDVVPENSSRMTASPTINGQDPSEVRASTEEALSVHDAAISD